MRMAGFRQIKSPVALATFGAFFVPEPLGTCLVLLAAIWWLWRKLYYSDDADLLLEISNRNLSFYIFRAGQNITTGTSHCCGYAPRAIGNCLFRITGPGIFHAES